MHERCRPGDAFSIALLDVYFYRYTTVVAFVSAAAAATGAVVAIIVLIIGTTKHLPQTDPTQHLPFS